MTFTLGPLGQIALAVTDVDRAEAFYGGVLGLRRLFRSGDLAFYDCGGLRLLLDKTTAAAVTPSGVLYFRVADIALAVDRLQQKGLVFTDRPHLIAPMPDHDLWMAFFADPDGNTLALMQEAPKGWKPAA